MTFAAASPLPADPAAWYGNINYLLNISAVGAAFCLLLFLLVKLRSDHRSLPSPSALAAKLLSVYHATPAQIARHCGADAAQFLLIERSSFLLLLAVTSLALFAAFPLNFLLGHASVEDQFAQATITHIPAGSPLLWAHFLLMILILALAHFGISRMEDQLRSDVSRNPGDTGSIAIFTIMLQGIPKALAADKSPLEDYFQHRYPGKVFRVVVPFDLCSLDELTTKWIKIQNDISRLEARLSAESLFGSSNSATTGENYLFRMVKYAWEFVKESLGFTEEDRLRKLYNSRLVLRSKLMEYREGRAPGAGIAFVVFRDVYTTNKAVRDFQTERSKQPIGRFFPVTELQLERSRWRVERAPPASDIYWNHLGLRKLSLRLCRGAVNTCLLLMLLFCSSPLAVISAMKTAARIINAEAMDNAQLWLAWIEGSSWFGTVFLQFMPNVLIFVSMYIIVPSALSYLSKFERHLTVSGEQRAALLKMVCFFLVNLILLRAMVESSLEGAILSMGRCYLDGEDCKRIEEYMSPSFLSRSCVSSLAFLIASTFLGISFDLLAPIPWIKKTLRKFRKNDMILKASAPLLNTSMSPPGCLSAVSTAHLSPPPMAAVGLGLGGAVTGCSRLLSPLHRRSSKRRHVVRMAPEEEKITRRSPLDFPIEWERPKPGRRPDIFPQFSPMKSPLPTPLPADPPEEDEEEEEEEKKEEEEEDPNKEEPEQPDKQQSRMEKRGGWWP